MSTGLILWLILAVTSVHSIVIVRVAAENEKYFAAVKELKKKVKPKTSVSSGVLMLVTAYAAAALWTWYSVATGDWRFAAVAWAPSVAKVLLLIVSPKARA